MKRIYYYFFYKFYKMSEAAPSKWASDWKASIVIAALEIWLLFSLINYYNVFVDKDFFLPQIFYIIIGVAVFVLNYYLFIHTDIWKEYVKEYDKLPKDKNRLGGIIVFFTTFFILFNIIYSFYLMSKIY